MPSETALCDLADISKYYAALWEVKGRWEIERIDEDAPDDYTDDDALRAVIEAAGNGDRGALLALYLDGRPVEDQRMFWPGLYEKGV